MRYSFVMSNPQNPDPDEAAPTANDTGNSWQVNDPNSFAPQDPAGRPATGQDAVNQAYGQTPQAQPQQPTADGGAQIPQAGQALPPGQFPPAGPQAGQFPPAGAAMGSSVPARKNRSLAIRIISVVLVIILIAVAKVIFDRVSTSHDATKDVGKCVTLSGTQNDVKTERVDCGTEGSYYVAKAGADETCADVSDTDKNYGGTYDEITVQGSRGSTAKMCLVPEFTEGNCYSEDRVDLAYQEVDCNDVAAYIHIDRIIEEYDATCPDTSIGGLTYDVPARTYCVSQPV